MLVSCCVGEIVVAVFSDIGDSVELFCLRELKVECNAHKMLL